MISPFYIYVERFVDGFWAWFTAAVAGLGRLGRALLTFAEWGLQKYHTHRPERQQHRQSQPVKPGMDNQFPRLPPRSRHQAVLPATPPVGALLTCATAEIALAIPAHSSTAAPHLHPTIRGLIASLRSGDLSTVLGAVQSLQHLAQTNDEAIMVLIAALGAPLVKDFDGEIKTRYVVEAIVHVGERSIPPLTGALNHPNPDVRNYASMALARL